MIKEGEPDIVITINASMPTVPVIIALGLITSLAVTDFLLIVPFSVSFGDCQTMLIMIFQ